MSSESDIVKMIEAKEEGEMDISAAQAAMWQLINARKSLVVQDG